MWRCCNVCMKVLLTLFVGTQGEDKGFQVCRKKMATSAEVLCKYNAPEFCKFTEAVLEMKFDEDPKYAALIALFEPILAGCVHKPICVDSAIKVCLALAAAAALCLANSICFYSWLFEPRLVEIVVFDCICIAAGALSLSLMLCPVLCKSLQANLSPLCRIQHTHMMCQKDV